MLASVDRLSSRIGGSLRVVREIYQNEGGIIAFYRGLTPNVIGNSTSWGLYFLFYSNIKDIMHGFRDPGRAHLTSSDYFIASGTAGMPDECQIRRSFFFLCNF